MKRPAQPSGVRITEKRTAHNENPIGL